MSALLRALYGSNRALRRNLFVAAAFSIIIVVLILLGPGDRTGTAAILLLLSALWLGVGWAYLILRRRRTT